MRNVLRALTAVAAQSVDPALCPAHAPTHTCRSRGSEDVPYKRRVAQEISLPWEPLETIGSKEMKKIALSRRFLVCTLAHVRDSDAAGWLREWMLFLGSPITPLACSTYVIVDLASLPHTCQD
jgi:hypothetical protein